ncbi:MAG: TIGR01440 family protein [Ruminococcaceae bacterium]|nr:TIGR01440 family protein [Oscillospiraceae bacterium]
MSNYIETTITRDAETAIRELIEVAHLTAGQILVIGCSSSEMVGERIGKHSSMEAALSLRNAVLPILEERGILLAVQCCEHLNRALIVERTTAEKFGYDPVWVKPQPKAGGSFATAVWDSMTDPVAIEFIQAHAGMDIGGTLIGMHLRRVAVPVRLSVSKIGEASLVCARTRPAYIGGPRAEYQTDEP